jgi:hypothetical protein
MYVCMFHRRRRQVICNTYNTYITYNTYKKYNIYNTYNTHSTYNAPNTIHTIHTIHYTQYTPIHPIHKIHPTHPKRGGSVAFGRPITPHPTHPKRGGSVALGRPITPHPTHPKRGSSNIFELVITAALTKFSNFENCIYFEMGCSQVSCTCIRFPFFFTVFILKKNQQKTNPGEGWGLSC